MIDLLALFVAFAPVFGFAFLLVWLQDRRARRYQARREYVAARRALTRIHDQHERTVR